MLAGWLARDLQGGFMLAGWLYAGWLARDLHGGFMLAGLLTDFMGALAGWVAGRLHEGSRWHLWCIHRR